MDPYDRVIWSADVPDRATVEAKLNEMFRLNIIKLDRFFLEVNGLEVIELISSLGVKVFVDAKIIEIPSKMVLIAQNYLRFRPWMLNCMAGGFSTGIYKHENIEKIDGLKRFADTCHLVETRPCAVTVLTSKTPDVVGAEFNGRTNVDQVLFYVNILSQAGFTDIVCSPLEAAAIRTDKQFDHLEINTPGVRPRGTSTEDQARTDTPGGAIKAGATRVIMGRALNSAEDLENIIAEIKSVS